MVVFAIIFFIAAYVHRNKGRAMFDEADVTTDDVKKQELITAAEKRIRMANFFTVGGVIMLVITAVMLLAVFSS